MGNPPTPQEAAIRIRPVVHRPMPSQERQALTFLQRELVPELERSHRGDLALEVRHAVEEGSLAALDGLSPAHKHSLLGAIEARMGRGSRAGRPGPSVVVRLICSLDLTPGERVGIERRGPVLPAR